MTSDRKNAQISTNVSRPAVRRARVDGTGAARAAQAVVFAALAVVATSAGAAEGDADTLATTARAVLEEHCSRCHQDGSLAEGLERPEGKFGYILDLERLVRKRMVIPGNSSGSTIMRQIENGSMPRDMAFDCYLPTRDEDTYCGPSPEDVAVVRDWIDSLDNPDVALLQQTASAAADTEEPAGEGDDAGRGQVVPDQAEATPDAAPEATPDQAEATPDASADATPDATADATPDAAPETVPDQAEAAPELPDATEAAVAQPRFLRDDDMLRVMALDLNEVPEARRDTQRYITLWHLKNAGDEEDALTVYRMAIVKLLNSLSRKPNPVIPVVVDEDQTILRFDMQDLGWTDTQWDKIAAANPYLMKYDNTLYDSLVDNTETQMPFVRADWFAFVASQPPLYHELLGLPDTKAELEELLGVDSQANINSLDVQRAGFRRSGVSQNNRMIERHQAPTGAYWESYDFAGNADRQDFFNFPVGPTTAFDEMGEEHGFKHDGGEIIFALPNGFHAYYLTTGVGARLDQGPTSIVLDPSRHDSAVTNGISCMGCHNYGIKYNPHRPTEAMDEVREIVLSNLNVPREVRDTVEEIFPPHERMYEIMQRDGSDFERALEAAGVNMNVNYDGMEMVNALFARFEEDVTAQLAAAEFGLTEEEFFSRLGVIGGDAAAMRIRLSQDVYPRDQFVKQFATIAELITDNEPISFDEVVEASAEVVATSEARDADSSKTFDLSFVPTTETYGVGDEVKFVVQSAEPCFLTLVNVDDSEQTQIVFPNKFNDENEIEAGREYTIPSDEIGGFKFVFSDPGTEKVIAICNAVRSTPRGIVHDFDNEAYTTFRSLDEFTTFRLLSVESDGRAIQGEEEATPLVENNVDPQVDIVAQKAVVLEVQ